MILLPYKAEARSLIREGDILLYRAPHFPKFGWWVKTYCGGIHSHVSVASWRGKPIESVLECVEFKEFKGGRTIALSNRVRDCDERIDVFRPTMSMQECSLENGVISYHWKKYDLLTARRVTDTIRNLTGLPYGWKNILAMSLHYLPVIRLFQHDIRDDEIPTSFVCSVCIAYALRLHYKDLVPYKPDGMTQPADLASSPLLNYLFTIKNDLD